ncbi:hypothetical protein V5N11_002021 [Cardamine amara subsp. amara]|uniref:DUF577 domain-containing protein n=1 Tax=Cardamine amara subsp. amara TaxID=228776 RepID=A0ABD0ZRE7_CARAN
MAEKAREIIVSRSHEELATLVNQLFMSKETKEYKTASALYDFCVSDFPNCLTLKLLEVYQCSSNGVIRFQSIYLLSETLNEFRNRNFSLSRVALHEIKPLLISCLKRQETQVSDIKILRRIVSFVAYNVVTLYNDKWEELSECIFLLAEQETVKAFHIFIDLPPVYQDFIFRFMVIFLEKTKQIGVEDWSLALKTVVKLGIQFFNIKMKLDVIKKIMGNQLFTILNSAHEIVMMGKEQFLVRGLEDFKRFLLRDMSLYKYTKIQCEFVSESMIKIGEIGGIEIKEIVKKIVTLVTKPSKNDFRNDIAEYDCDWYDHLMNLSSPQVLEIFVSTQLEDRSRELAIRRLNFLLSDHTNKKVKIYISEFRKLQPLLISCLKEEGISESMFKVLGELVNHVAREIFVNQDEKWDGLVDYIASQSKTEFQKAVYIFQCLTMALHDDDFVIPVMENLLPEIRVRLNPPRELFVDYSSWFLAFTGAFCASIHLVETPSQVKSVEEIADKMIDSVRELVERRMEVGLVRRAFRDVENIVKKQIKWYDRNEYKFIKGLLWRLYAIKGMKWESKIVLWRINVIVEREVDAMAKELPENLPEA